MPIRRVIDSNIIIYSLLENHPACSDCASYLTQFDVDGLLFSTVDSLSEIYQVMHGFYKIESSIILDHIKDLLNSRITFLNLDQDDLNPLFEIVAQNNLQVNDIKLYLLAQKLQAPILVTDDGTLGNFAQSHQLLHETPIQPETRAQMDEWEQEHLPKKGLPRVLKRIFIYLENLDKLIATQFRNDSGNFRQIPEN